MANGLTDEQVTLFHAQGYVVVPGLFGPEELEPLRREIADIIGVTADRLFDEGRIARKHADASFETRLTRLMEDNPDLTPEYMRAVEGRAGGGHTGIEMFRIITHPKLLDAMESLVGPEIIGSSVYRIRPKVPGFARGVVPWHQDSGYFSSYCDRNLIVTVWMPLVDATPENGCLQVLPRTHDAGVFTHRTGGNAGYLVIEDDDLPLPPDRAVTVPVPLGGALLLTNLTPHCSTPNTTDVVRWSVDLRYQGADAPTNADKSPGDLQAVGQPDAIACYAPEGDFLVRSREHPDAVHTYAQFAARRNAYENAAIPAPSRGWQPASTKG